jgi:biotin---protein ligase
MPYLTKEEVLGTVVPKFEILFKDFVQYSGEFHPFITRYLSCWMHSYVVIIHRFDGLLTFLLKYSHQIVTIQSTGQKVKITGITTDYGLLRTEPLEGGGTIDLQPDGNSFDMLQNLIKKKN